jgi:endonuclease III
MTAATARTPRQPARRRGPSPQKLAADRRARRRLAEIVLDRLGERYGRPTWAGPRVDTISELVLTILSQNTADTNSFRAFTALRERYGDWQAVLEAPTDELEDVIRPGGLAPTKSKRIQHVLAEVHGATAGTWDLGFLATVPLEEARAWLTSLPGIGRKTASIILLFNFGRPAMPVDTHVHRVATRLGLIPPRTPLDRAHDLLEGALAPDEMYPFHVDAIRHGRDTCRAPRPICGLCPLTDVCPYYALAVRGRAPMAPIPKVIDPARSARYHDELIHGWRPPEAAAGEPADASASDVQGLAAMDEQKRCPSCNEPIGDSDVVCPHCGETLVGG